MPDTPNCFLCKASEPVVVHTLTADEILKCWAIHGCRFEDDAIGLLKQEGNIALYRCRCCGFEYFNPQLEGNSKFYQSLFKQLPIYYATDSEENLRNVRYAVSHGFKNILDVGCGDGQALDNAKRAGLETFGIEPSPTAAAAAAARGHTIFPVFLEKMDSAWDGKFDLISFNQVLEHVSTPVELIKSCARLLSPDGVISITVPGSTGILRFSPWLEYNWPPHHVSRWRIKDFYQLAAQAGFQVLAADGSPLHGHEIKSNFLEHRIRCQILNKPYHGPTPFLIKSLNKAYKLAGLKFLCHRGHSVCCYLSHPKL